MSDARSYSAMRDPVTESNTSLLATSHEADELAKNRKLCRQHGVKDGPKELRRLQRFVSQEIIKLLTRHNITQQSGRPYVSSSPKGFLQDPDEWLAEKGYHLSGWPRGLPRGSVSIWPTHYIFALAAMFINGTITLRPLAQWGPTRKEIDSLKSRTSKSEGIRTINPASPSYNKGRKDTESDRDTERHSQFDHRISLAPRASTSGVLPSETNRDRVPNPSQASQRASCKIPSSWTIIPSTPFSLLTARSGRSKRFIQDAPGKPTPPSLSLASLSRERPYLGLSPTDAYSIELLASSGCQSDVSRKRRLPETAGCPAIPFDATVDWIPPVSATRESKRIRTL